MIRFRSWAVSHPGAVRAHNEDAFVDRPEIGLWAIADGAGGHQSGEVASAAVCEALEGISSGLSASETIAAVRDAIAGAHRHLLAEAARRGGNAVIASTVVVLLTHAGHCACLWAGDSRIYRWRDGGLEQLTRDHSLVQDLVDAGVLAPENAETHPHANVITRAIGADAETLELDKLTEPVQPGDRFLLCSDGLFKAIDHSAVAALMGGNSEDAAQDLIDAALRAHASDNVTAVIVEAMPVAGSSGDGA